MNDLDKKIRKLAHLCDAPTWLIKESIGIPLEHLSAESFREIKMAYVDADEDSEEQHVAFEKLRSMLLTELKTSRLTRTKEIYDLAIEFNIHDVKVEALHHWNDLSLDEVQTAKNYEQLDLAYERAHSSSSAKRAALEKRAQWAEEDFKKAHTFDRMLKACKNAPQGSETKRKIIKEIYQRYFETGSGPALD